LHISRRFSSTESNAELHYSTVDVLPFGRHFDCLAPAILIISLTKDADDAVYPVFYRSFIVFFIRFISFTADYRAEHIA